MQKNRNSGFSLAELLIVVAIVVVLMAVAFVAVQNYQNSMTRLEFDTIAKEIFIAAQNHLTTAENQGYPENISFGHKGTAIDDDDETAEIWYVVSSDSDTLKDIMLPDYALDDMALSGSYIIRYQPYPATVLDVFYSREGKSSFLSKSGTTLGEGDYTALMGSSPNYRAGGEKNRENYNGKVIGWYGGAAALAKGERLKTPTFEIINAEKLLVKVSNLDSFTTDSGYNVKLIVTGVTSKKEAYFSLIKNGAQGDGPGLSDGNTIILDSITDSALHFSQLTGAKGLFPGEDLRVKVVAYNTAVLSNVAMSAEKITNSLFADPYPYTDGEKIRGSDVEKGIAGINNIRHLENLNAAISNYNPSSLVKTGTPNQGVQLRDLSWTDFKDKTDGDSTTIHPVLGTAPAAAAGSYYPVSPGYVLAYKGQNYTISDISVSIAVEAGLFGTLSAGSSVSDLKLVDFDIASTSGGNAGALAGSVLNSDSQSCTIKNVLAQNSKRETTNRITASATMNAGGLIGEMTGGTVQYSAAAVIVGDDTAKPKNAGGLIGTMTGGTINGCYSGGHTQNGSYNEWVKNSVHPYDVTGVTAGGLVGNSSATMNNSYSTCSVSGTTAGGFVGSASGDITNCYAAGLVETGTILEKDDRNTNAGKGAFAASMTGTLSDCRYFMVINAVIRTETQNEQTVSVIDHYLGAVGDQDREGITPLDLNAGSYNEFTGAWDNWGPAVTYDPVLKDYYSGKYPLRSVQKLIGTDKPAETTVYKEWKELFATTHYGDWPSPEVFFVN